MSVVWPVAVLVALEIMARVEWPDGRRWLAVRWLGLTPVGVVAAVVSYRHLSALLGWYGEDGITTTIGPLAIDGLMLLASGALLAAGGVLGDDTAPDTVADIPPDVPADTGAVIRPGTGADTGADTQAVKARTPARTSGRTSGRAPVSTADAVARWRDKHPDMSTAEIARRVKVTERTVRRYLAETRPVQAPDAADTAPEQPADLLATV